MLTRLGRYLALIGISSLFLAKTTGAQDVEMPYERPSVGLALSGGGAKGFAHVGVLKVLEEVGLPIDAVTGTSMGSVVGGLYAVGYSSGQIDEIAHSQDWNAMFSNATPRRLQPVENRLREERLLFTLPLRKGRPGLPVGLIPGQRIAMTLSRLTLPVHDVRDFTKLPVPFACVATDLETGEGVRLDHGSLPRAIEASIAIPTVFNPVKIGDRTFIDGGVARNIPAEDVRALGADVVICVDVSSTLQKVDSLHSLVDILQQAVDYRIHESNVRQRRQCDVVIQPDVLSYSVFDFDHVTDIIQRGEDAARAVMPRLQQLADSVGRVANPRRVSPTVADSLFISRIRLDDVDPGVERQVRMALGFDGNLWLTPGDLEAAIERIYSRQVFGYVTFQLEPDAGGEGTVLVLHASERRPERLGIGIRYDSRDRAAILIDATVRAIDRRTLSLQIRLGEVLQVGSTFSWLFRPRVGGGFLFRATRGSIDLFEEGVRVSRVRTEVVEVSSRASLSLTNSVIASLSVGGELYNLNRSVGVTSFLDEARGLLTGRGRLYLDTFDQNAFPHRGHRLVMESGIGAPLNESPFTYHQLDWQARWPLNADISLMSRVLVGQAFGDMLPLHYRFYMGGTFEYEYASFSTRQHPLLGFSVQQLGGRSMQAIDFGVQYRLKRAIYLQALWNAAYVSNEGRWGLNTEAYRQGVGLTVGARTLIGPVKVTFVSRSATGPFDLQVSVGHVF